MLNYSNSAFNIFSTSLIVSSSRSVRFTRSSIFKLSTLRAVSQPMALNSSMIQLSISSANSSRLTSSSSAYSVSRYTSISYPVSWLASLIFNPPFPIARETSLGLRYTSAFLFFSSIFSDEILAGLSARVI